VIQTEVNEKLLYEEITRLKQQSEVVSLANESEEAKALTIKDKYLEDFQIS
jgi:hypothetical protein